MKKIMILGSKGMLGHMVFFYLQSLDEYQIINVTHNEKLTENSILIDATDKSAVKKLILSEKPDIVINCIGVLIKGSQSEPSNAVFLNSFLPHYLSKVLSTIGGKLIHISTDCVFSGTKGMYAEDDFRDADDIYGRSKALGEINNKRDLTIRTSIVGPELKKNGEGIFHWFMNETGQINGYSNVYWGGVTTLELAKIIHNLMLTDICGLINITNGDRISKYDLLNFIKKIWDKSNIQIKSNIQKSSDKSLISIRPLSNHIIPSYENMLVELYDYMLINKSFYKQYFIS